MLTAHRKAYWPLEVWVQDGTTVPPDLRSRISHFHEEGKSPKDLKGPRQSRTGLGLANTCRRESTEPSLAAGPLRRRETPEKHRGSVVKACSHPGDLGPLRRGSATVSAGCVDFCRPFKC